MKVYGNRKELAELLEVNPSMINKHKNSGILKDCMSHDGKLYHLEKSMECILKSKRKETHNSKVRPNKKVQMKSIPKNIKDTELNNPTNKQELEELIQGALNALQSVAITKEFWQGKINEQKFKKEEGELISLNQAKGVVDVMFTPLSRKLDDIHIDLKSRYPDVEMEAINWLGDYVNEIKKSVSEHVWSEV